MKIKFESIDIEGGKCIKEIEITTWVDALRPFQEFLQGSGYIIDDVDFEDVIRNYDYTETADAE